MDGLNTREPTVLCNLRKVMIIKNNAGGEVLYRGIGKAQHVS